MSDTCDREVFEKGVPLVVIDGWAKDVEPWVQKVAARSGQRVDWHYSGGRAQVLVLGDHEKALAAARALEPELMFVPVSPDHPRFKEYVGRHPSIICWFAEGETGLYRNLGRGP